LGRRKIILYIKESNIMKNPLFVGAATAIVTPFTETGVDYEKFGELIDFQLSEGIDALVVCGTTGEASTMPSDEHIEVLKFAVDRVNKRVPVIGGTGSNDTRHSIEMSKKAVEVGCDALLQVTPYYNKTSQRGLYEHFKAIANSVDVPIILYNVPSRTNLNLNTDTLIELAKIENIVAVKECNLSQVADIVRKTGDDFSVYSGNDAEILPCLTLGGKGVISVVSNILPKKTHEIVMTYLEGNSKKASEEYLKMFDILNALGVDVNPIPIKAALNIFGKNIGKCRLPLVETTDKNKEVIKNALVEYGLINN
jgi:4-hydroxy-tetrahydrodipicolinate synthase